jgi:hypothetical protein
MPALSRNCGSSIPEDEPGRLSSFIQDAFEEGRTYGHPADARNAG